MLYVSNHYFHFQHDELIFFYGRKHSFIELLARQSNTINNSPQKLLKQKCDFSS